MNFNDNFNRNMAIQSSIYAIILFIFSIYCISYDISFFGIDALYYSLIASILGGLELIVAFDYYHNGAYERLFGLITLYLTGMVLGVIIFYLVILNIPMDTLIQFQSILKIEAVR